MRGCDASEAGSRGAARAVDDEPGNRRLRHVPARMRPAVAATGPACGDRAGHWHERACEVAPHQDPLMPAKPPPDLGRWR